MNIGLCNGNTSEVSMEEQGAEGWVRRSHRRPKLRQLLVLKMKFTSQSLILIEEALESVLVS